jgi:hypothetical protein
MKIVGKNTKNRQVSIFGFQCAAKNTSGFYLDYPNFDYKQRLPGSKCIVDVLEPLSFSFAKLTTNANFSH